MIAVHAREQDACSKLQSRFMGHVVIFTAILYVTSKATIQTHRPTYDDESTLKLIKRNSEKADDVTELTTTSLMLFVLCAANCA